MKNNEKLIPEKRLTLTPDSEMGKELQASAKGNYECVITEEAKVSNFYKEIQDVTHLELSGFGHQTHELIFATKIAGTSKTLQAVKLSLGKNDLYLYTWPDLIENLSKAPLLHSLDLSANEVGYIANELSYYITQYMPNLQILNLSNNEIGAETYSSVLQLLKLPQLQILDVSGNTSDQSIIDQIRDSVGNYNIEQPGHNESLFYALNHFVLNGIILKDIATNIMDHHEHPVELII